LQVEETFTNAGPAKGIFLHVLLCLGDEVSLFGDGTYFSTNEKIRLEADHASRVVLRGVATQGWLSVPKCGAKMPRWELWESTVQVVRRTSTNRDRLMGN
jgi:hypothetical protein